MKIDLSLAYFAFEEYGYKCAFCVLLLTFTIRYKKYEVCQIKECGKASNGRQYCTKHMNVAERRKLPGDMRATIRSLCCGAPCEGGAAHENGEQYCKKCKEPCLWKSGA